MQADWLGAVLNYSICGYNSQNSFANSLCVWKFEAFILQYRLNFFLIANTSFVLRYSYITRKPTVLSSLMGINAFIAMLSGGFDVGSLVLLGIYSVYTHGFHSISVHYTRNFKHWNGSELVMDHYLHASTQLHNWIGPSVFHRFVE